MDIGGILAPIEKHVAVQTAELTDEFGRSGVTFAHAVVQTDWSIRGCSEQCREHFLADRSFPSTPVVHPARTERQGHDQVVRPHAATSVSAGVPAQAEATPHVTAESRVRTPRYAKRRATAHASRWPGRDPRGTSWGYHGW